MDTKITFFIAVDENGDIGFHVGSAEDALQNLIDEIGTPDAADTYRITLNLNTPKVVNLTIGVADTVQAAQGEFLKVALPK